MTIILPLVFSISSPNTMVAFIVERQAVNARACNRTRPTSHSM